MYKPKNKDEYLDLVDQAIFETDDLLMSAEQEGEEDDFGAYVPIYEQIRDGLRKLHDDVQADRHAFADGTDLPFMALAQKWKGRLPHYSLIEAINNAHRRGF